MKPTAHNRLSTVALSVAIAIGIASLPAPSATAVAAEAKPTISRALAKPLQAAQKAVGEKKWDEAIAKLREAEGNASKTPFDAFVTSQLMAFALLQSGQQAAAIPYFEAQVASGFLEPAEADRIQKGVAQLYYQAKDYAKASAAGRKLIDGGTADDDVYTLVAQAEFLQDNFPGVVSTLAPYVQKLDGAGQSPKEPMLQLLSEAYLRQKDNASATGAFTLLVKHHPKPAYWSNLLMLKRAEKGGNDTIFFNIYRLMDAVGAMNESSDVLEAAQLAIKLGSPGEAQSILERANAGNVLKSDADKGAAQRQLEQAKTLAAADKGHLVDFEKEARASKAGEGEVRYGQALLSYGEYAKAAEAIQRGIAKGSVRNPDEAQILLGMALLGAGRKDEAVAAFGAAKGTNARLVDIASLWALHARR